MKRIAYVTDLHLDEPFPLQHHVDAQRNWLHVLNDIRKKAITQLVIGGDVGDVSSHQWFFKTLDGLSWQLTLGNHDNYDAVKKYLSLTPAGSGALWYRDEDTTFRCLFLDSSPDSLCRQQLQWLNGELKTEKKVVIFIHHPVLKVNTAVDTKYPLQNRDAVKQCLRDSNRDITLFCGHYHLEDEQQEGRIRQLTGPAVSFQMLRSAAEVQVDGSRFGYRIIQFEKSGLIETTVKLFKNNQS